MTREIKFRAWDKKLKIMLNKKHGLKIEIFKNHGYGIWRNRLKGDKPGIWYAHRFSNKEIVLMQYTGLKDKNGKEIYEGDILEVDNESRIMFDAVGSNGSGVRKYQEVGFQEGCFMTRRNVNQENLSRKFDTYLWLIAKDSIIKGNIYENPDYLITFKAFKIS